VFGVLLGRYGHSEPSASGGHNPKNGRRNSDDVCRFQVLVVQAHIYNRRTDREGAAIQPFAIH
jgi:hypothetical protein